MIRLRICGDLYLVDACSTKIVMDKIYIDINLYVYATISQLLNMFVNILHTVVSHTKGKRQLALPHCSYCLPLHCDIGFTTTPHKCWSGWRGRGHCPCQAAVCGRLSGLLHLNIVFHLHGRHYWLLIGCS